MVKCPRQATNEYPPPPNMHPRGGYIVSLMLSLEVATPENKEMNSKLPSNMQEKTHKARKSASKVVLSRMQLTLHATRRTPHGDSRLVHAVFTWSVKTRRAPSRRCRDARVYTAMHETSTPPTPHPPNSLSRSPLSPVPRPLCPNRSQKK